MVPRDIACGARYRATVDQFRRLVRRHRHVAATLIVLALAMKLLVPAGFMPTASAAGGIVIQICSGTSGQAMVMTLPGSEQHDNGEQAAKADMPCAFSGLSSPTLAAVDPVLLALAIAFVVALGLRSTRLLLPPLPIRLRPPLRGPPSIA